MPLAGRLPTRTTAIVPSTSVPPSDRPIRPSSRPEALPAVASGASFTAVRLICVPPDALALPLDTVKVNPPTGAVPS